MIIVGLGNPGPEYENTRHNVGFWAVDAAAERFKTRFTPSPWKARAAAFSFKGAAHHLVKPITFMNLSGESVSRIMAAEGCTASDLLVIVDDVNIPVGRLRLRPSGSEGGHNGLRSIIGYIGQDFWRLRLGVGKPAQGAPGGGLVDHVLGPVPAGERAILELVLRDVPEIITLLLLGMGPKAMSRFNCRDYAAPPAAPPARPPAPPPGGTAS
ncbi:MAG: aminoacyl-tRNA hydrolase [Candidatus Riflebacteria bacterium]|nr:aminoacyl-tRNA hydrolase [Candidatus Riflebacteria bacterium]